MNSICPSPTDDRYPDDVLYLAEQLLILYHIKRLRSRSDPGTGDPTMTVICYSPANYSTTPPDCSHDWCDKHHMTISTDHPLPQSSPFTSGTPAWTLIGLCALIVYQRRDSGAKCSCKYKNPKSDMHAISFLAFLTVCFLMQMCPKVPVR